MKANQAELPVRCQCEVLGVSTSGYYDWLDRSPSQRAQANVNLVQSIKQAHLASDATYGMPRIRAELADTAGAIVATYDAATSANLSISGSTLTINPTTDLSPGTAFKVEFDAGSVKDLAGNSFAGTTSHNFTTASGDTTPAGSNLVAAIQSSTGVTLNPVLQATLTARLQQMFDTGTYSALAASVAMQAFSTSLKAMVDANGGTGAFLAHVSAVVAALGGGTDVPDFGAGGASAADYLDPLEAQSAGVMLMGVQEMALDQILV